MSIGYYGYAQYMAERPVVIRRRHQQGDAPDGARDDAQTLPILDSVQKLEIEARDKKIAALEEEIRKLREGALRKDPAVAMKKIPRRATADFLANSCGQIATSRKIH
jgi:hypothetical protein